MATSFIDEIRFNGTNDDILWKSPCHTVSNRATVYSEENYDVVIYKDGTIIGSFSDSKSKHNVTDEGNGLLAKLFTKAKEIDNVEVYYINKKLHYTNEWGTPNRINYRDPLTGLVTTLGANGTYVFTVENSLKFITRVGKNDTIGKQEVSDILFSELISTIRDKISSIIDSKGFTIEDLMKITVAENEIASESKIGLQETAIDYGITIERFTIDAIVFEKEFIEKFKSMSQDAGLEAYMSKQAINVSRNNAKSARIESGEEHYDDSIKFCPNCGTKNDKSAKFCNGCGEKLENSKENCPNCNEPIKKGAKFCHSCGTKV